MGDDGSQQRQMWTGEQTSEPWLIQMYQISGRGSIRLLNIIRCPIVIIDFHIA